MSDTLNLALLPAPAAKPPTRQAGKPDPRQFQKPDLRPAAESRFAFVDALRGLAALAVAFHHIFRYGPLAPPALKVVPHFASVLMTNGRMGVQVFFVISGFVIAYVLRNARIDFAYLRTFIVQRALRLGPPYWFAMLFVVGLYTLTRAFFLAEPTLLNDYPTFGNIAAHVFYLQNILHYENISVGFWTLCIEMQFYILFALMLGLAQWIGAAALRVLKGRERPISSSLVLMAVFAPLALMSLFKYNLDNDNTDWVSHFFICFFLGAMIWWALDRRVPYSLFWAFIGAALWRQGIHPTLHMTVAISTAVTIFLVGRWGRLGDWLNFRWLQHLGRISYSLYLIHYPVSWIVGCVGFALTGTSIYWAVAWLLTSLALSLGAAHVMYVAIELPAIRFARRYREAHGGMRLAAAVKPAVAVEPVRVGQ